MSTDGCQQDALHSVVSVSLAAGVAVASSAATALVCVVLCAIIGRHIIKRKVGEPELAIEHDHHKPTEDQHERDCSNTQAIKSTTSPAASVQSETPTLRASPSHALNLDGTDMLAGQSPCAHAQDKLDRKDGPLTPFPKESTRLNKLASSKSFASVNKKAPQQGLLEPDCGNLMAKSTSTCSLMEYTPSVYRFAPPESIVRSQQSPPNLTTEYSAVSLSGFAEFAPWVVTSALDAPERLSSTLLSAVEAPRTV